MWFKCRGKANQASYSSIAFTSRRFRTSKFQTNERQREAKKERGRGRGEGTKATWDKKGYEGIRVARRDTKAYVSQDMGVSQGGALGTRANVASRSCKHFEIRLETFESLNQT